MDYSTTPARRAKTHVDISSINNLPDTYDICIVHRHGIPCPFHTGGESVFRSLGELWGLFRHWTLREQQNVADSGLMKAREERHAILGVVTPKREDVLSGRGPSCARHNATTLWWSLVQSHAAQYRCCSNRHTKGLIVKTICDKVHKAGGRFLEKRDDCLSQEESFWDEIQVRVAHLKTSQALRDIRTDLEPQSQKHGKLEQTPKSVAEMVSDALPQDIGKKDKTIADGGLKNDSALEHGLSIQANENEDRHRTDASWNESLVRDTVLQNALIFKDSHQQHDDDLDLHGAMLSLATQQPPRHPPLATILTEIGTDHPPIALPLYFPNYQHEVLGKKHCECPPSSRLDVSSKIQPTDPPLALPLREQLSGDSRDWMPELWTSPSCTAHGQGHLGHCPGARTHARTQRICVENPARAPASTLAQKRAGEKMMQHASVASKKPKQNAPIEKPCVFALQEQLSGDSHHWHSFDLSNQNQDALPKFMSPEPRARFFPSDSVADQLVVNSSDPWSLSVPFHDADAMRDPPAAPALLKGMSTTSLLGKNMSNPYSTKGSETGNGSSMRTIYGEPSLGDLSDVFSSFEKLDQTIREFRCVMPEARNVEMEYRELLSKSTVVCNLSSETRMESDIDMNGIRQDTFPTHVAV